MKLCLIFNTAPRYRESIYQLLDKEFDCDWYFGPKLSDIKEMDFSILKRVYRYKIFGNPSKIYLKIGLFSLLFKKEYQTFLLTSETRCITDWIFIWIAHLFFRKKRIYTWGHTWYGKESKIEKILRLWQIRQRTGSFAYGNYARDLLMGLGMDGSKIFVIHNSLHYDQQKTLRDSMQPSNIYQSHFHNDYPVLIFIGRLTKVKQLDLLIEALSNLKKSGECYNLTFVGDGVECDNLTNLVKECGLENQVWFYGSCYDEKINAELIYNADLCVAPGNIGLTAMHTMVFGTPCISHNDFSWQMPEFEAIHPGLTGDFFKRGDVHSLESVIHRWFLLNGEKRDEIRLECYKEIDTQWNPYFQIEVFKNVLLK